jgi:hypothetical protein
MTALDEAGYELLLVEMRVEELLEDARYELLLVETRDEELLEEAGYALLLLLLLLLTEAGVEVLLAEAA